MRTPAARKIGQQRAPTPSPAALIDMHDNHLANAIAKASREGDAQRLAALKAERTRRG